MGGFHTFNGIKLFKILNSEVILLYCIVSLNISDISVFECGGFHLCYLSYIGNLTDKKYKVTD